jgi:hypothetical protein
MNAMIAITVTTTTTADMIMRISIAPDHMANAIMVLWNLINMKRFKKILMVMIGLDVAAKVNTEDACQPNKLLVT